MTDGDQPNVSLADLDRAPVNLPVPAGPQDPAAFGELLERFNRVSNENFNLRAQVDELKRKAATSAILDTLIKPYAKAAFRFMYSYSIFVAVVLIGNGLSSWSGFSLPNEVLTTMVGSTAVTVIGLVGMVLTGIFVGARKGGG